NHRAIADATAGKAGYGLAASGTVATASVYAPVTASIGGGAITLQDDLDIDAAATVQAEALAKGINVSAGAGVGASVATATATPVVSAAIGLATTVVADNVYVDAAQRVPAGAASAHAHATGASGGLLLGANATSATARNLGEVRAAIGDNATLTVSGITRVSADNASRQRAEAE